MSNNLFPKQFSLEFKFYLCAPAIAAETATEAATAWAAAIASETATET
jgi:hypothetical protein